MMNRIIEIAGYLLAAVIIVVGTIALIAYGNGYNYDFADNHLVRNGLVILESTPSGASLELDAQVIAQKTPYRRTFKAGVHTIALTKPGYREWRKSVIVTPSGVNLLQNIILLPQHMGVEELTTFTHISSSTPTIDHKKLALSVTGSPNEGVWLYDVGSKSQAKVFTPKAAAEAQPAESVVAVSWSGDSSHLLIQTSDTQKTQFYLVPATGSDATINLSTVFNADLTGLAFNPTNWRELYWNSSEGLRRLDAVAQTTSGVLATHVVSFDFAADRIVYVDSSKPVRSLWLLDRAGRRQQVAGQVPAGETYGLGYSTLLGVPEVALTALPAGTTIVYRNAFAEKPTVQAIPVTGDSIKFNNDGHFLLVWSAGSLASYDVEKNLINTFPLLGATASQVNWFDDFHVLFNRSGQTVMTEFDGTNGVALTRTGDTASFSTPDHKSVLTVGITSTGTSQLKLVKIRP